MKYIPNLISKDLKVLPGYFVSNSSSKKPNDSKPPLIFLLIAILFFVVAAISWSKILIAILYLLIGIICTQKGKNWFEKAGRFILTAKIRIVFCSILFLLSLPLWPYYNQQEKDEADLQALHHKQALQATADSLKFDQQRKDSLQYYFLKSKAESSQLGLADLLKAENFITNDSDKVKIKQAKKALSLKLINALMLASNYKSAIISLKDLLHENPQQFELFYKRAQCYLKTGNLRLAVNDLDTAKSNGFKQASVLYNKVNPIRRRVAYYTTRCCDGSTSSAKGRGACSWHGGVCNWNDPVYEEYRKY